MTVDAESKEQAEQACSRCHSVVYCSVECQQEDWKAFHQSECSQMSNIRFLAFPWFSGTYLIGRCRNEITFHVGNRSHRLLPVMAYKISECQAWWTGKT